MKIKNSTSLWVGLIIFALILHNLVFMFRVHPLSDAYDVGLIKADVRRFFDRWQQTDEQLKNSSRKFRQVALPTGEEAYSFRIELHEFAHFDRLEWSRNAGLLDNPFDHIFRQSDMTALFTVYESEATSKVFHLSPDVVENPMPFIALLSSEVVHGSRDNEKNFEELVETLGERHLSLTCGKISAFTREILRWLGVRSRIVVTLTMDDWNSYDNGHTLLEVYVQKKRKWVLVDLDQKAVFLHPKSQRALSALEVFELGIDSVIIQSLADVAIMDYGGSDDYHFLLDYLHHNRGMWYQRIFQSVGIYDDREKYFAFYGGEGDQSSRQKIESYSSSYRVISSDDFKRRFYLGPSYADSAVQAP